VRLATETRFLDQRKARVWVVCQFHKHAAEWEPVEAELARKRIACFFAGKVVED
jgi:hypothetical protein